MAGKNTIAGAQMSGIGGIVNGIDYSLLFADSTSTSNASAAILSDLYPDSSTNTAPTTFVSTGNPLTDLKIAQSQQTADVAQEAKQPVVSEAITQFTKAVANSKNISDALANPYVQQVLLTANGLSSYIGQTALVQKAFLSNPSDSKSLVNQLNDSSLLSAVQTYNFASTGLAELQNPKIIATLTNAYAEVEWRQSLNQATPGLSNALDFLSQASSIKSVNDILGNQTNFDVITTALGIPQQIVNQDVSAVNAAITSKLNIAKLQDPNYVTSLTDQYLLTMQQQNTSSSSDSDSLTSLAVQASSLIA
jgi:hypothetical protein